VPRLGSRIDAVLISGPAIFPFEFKCGERTYHVADRNQAWDYALDLKNFHLASIGRRSSRFSLPQRRPTPTTPAEGTRDGVRTAARVPTCRLECRHREGLGVGRRRANRRSDVGNRSYQPTPTIIEAARALYSRHTVDSISRHDAGAKNLKVTSVAVEEIIERSRSRREKAIVFLTGVPGSGRRSWG